MFLVLVTPPGGIRFLSLAYPGILPGLGPSLNSRGVVQTTNYIAPVRIAEGVPRFFIGRAILEAPDLERAVELATLKERAHPWHHNLASLSERRLVSLETHPAPRFDLKEVEGVYIHTNHLVHPEMADLPEDKEYGAASSMTRYRVITEAVRRKSPENAKEAVGILSSHEGSPFSPCRHPVGEIHGATLATAVFQAPKIAMTLYYGNPCRGLAHEYTLTAQQTEKRAA
jgi:hypothetical protein